MGRFVRPVGAAALAVAVVLASGAVLAGVNAAHVAATPGKPITEAAAVADAMDALPNGGAGYRVVADQLEPSSKHFQWTTPSGSGFGEDQVRECLVMPPLPPIPWLSPCRYYPVWVVALSSDACQEVVAINALTGRFGGAGGNCDIALGGSPDIRLWQPTWN